MTNFSNTKWKLKIYPAVTYFLAGNFQVELEMEKKTIVGNNEGQFCLHRGESLFWLLIIVTQENFVLVNVFDKSRSITSFLSFSIHTISINTLITFFFFADGSNTHTHTQKSAVFISLDHCALN